MNSTELRGKIKEQLYTAVFDVTEHTRLHHDEIKPEIVPMDKLTDAILDAVIASLPEEVEENYDDFYDGYNSALAKVFLLLNSAKTKKGNK